MWVVLVKRKAAIFLYACACACVCVCMYEQNQKKKGTYADYFIVATRTGARGHGGFLKNNNKNTPSVR